MDTILKRSDNAGFANRMFASVVGIFLLLAILFLVFQYQRETEYKADILDNRLQVANYQVASAYPGEIGNISLPEGCRLTIVSLDGSVIYDNEMDISGMKNHIDRKEIQKALRDGSGYDIQRNSETLRGETFFYSATLFSEQGIIVRSALPYNSQLYKDLTIDKTFMAFIAITTLILCFVLYRIARHLALTEKQKNENDKHQLKRQLTQNAAHELKTPTASISAYLETILNTPDLSEDDRNHFLERSYAQCQRMTAILSDMSTLAQMDAVQQVQEHFRINVRELLENITTDVSLPLEQANMEVMLDMNDLTVAGDRKLIYSLFRNLFDNAIAYAGEGTHIEITAYPASGQMVEFFFSDDGAGVPQEHLPHLCERFYRIDKGRSRKLGGTGLGLAIVKNAVLLHGGDIELLQTPGGGLTIRFTLPIG